MAKKSFKLKTASLTRTPAFKPWTKNAFAGLLLVVAVSFILSVIGITWGETGYIPWQDDSLAGLTTVREMPRLFGEWTYKYPPLQFMINAVFYQPLLDSWHNNLDYNRMNTLIFVANIISMLMGIGTVIAVFLTARILFDDFVAAFFAALSLALCQEFLFYSHLGNVDIPATFWFAWGVCFAVKAAYIGKWRHYIFAAIFCAFSVCTKDSMPAFIAGLLIAVAVIMVAQSRNSGKTIKQSILAFFSGKTLIAIIMFLFFYALVNGIITNPGAFIRRFEAWFGERGIQKWNRDYTGQLPLLWRTCSLLYGSLGWPLLALITASLIYCAVRFRQAALLAIMPAIAFHLIVTANIHLVHSRYLIPAYVCLVLVAGKGCADLLRWQTIPTIIRAVPIVIIYILSLLYCIGLDLELLGDSRYDAEAWFVKNAGPADHIAIITDIRWSPRLQLTSLNYSYRITGPHLNEPITAQVLLQKPLPQYVVLNENYLGIFDPAFRKALLDGSIGYKQVAKFENKYLYPKKTVFGFAGWPAPKEHFISPVVLVYKKQ